MLLSSTAWMTAFDCLIIILAGLIIIFCLRNKEKFRAANAQRGAFSILLAICITAIFYLSDLVTMHILPMFMPMMKAMSYMNYLHLNVSWYVNAISVTSIVLGFMHVTRSLFLSRDKVDAALAELDQRDGELRSQNERFNVALDNMSQGLCMFDGEQRLIVSNERYAAMYGLSSELLKPGIALRQILEHRIANGIFAGGDPEAYIQERIAWVTSGTRSSKIQDLSDGRAIAIVHQPMSGGGWLTTHEDVTDRTRKSDLLRATVDSFPGGISVIDRGFHLAMANDRFYQQLELPQEAFPVGCRYEDIVRFNAGRGDYGPGDVEELVRERLESAKEPKEHFFERRRRDGTVLEIRRFPLQQGGFVTTFVDITERKKAEAINLKLARIVEDSINEVFVFDAETLKFLQVNASACRNLGYGADELAELTPIDLQPELTRERFEDIIAPLRRGEKDHIRIQARHRRKDGSHYDTDLVLQQIQAGDRPVFAAIIEDITDRRRAEKELIRHRDHLQELVDIATQELQSKAEELKDALVKEKELNELQRQFVSMVSHEFRTPLAIIDTTAQRLKSRADKNLLTPEDAAQRVEKVRDAVRRMTRLMETTLAAARMQDGKVRVEIEPCDIGKVVREVCMRQQEIAERHVISCDVADLPATIQADAGCLEQVLTNLLSNAVKYALDAPDIEVKARAEGHEVVIAVCDHGIGIDEEDLGRIGERFFRAKTSTGIAGTGIGLSLVKTLVEEHGGSVNVESKKGDGSTFTVRLPISGPRRVGRAERRVA